MAGALPRGVPRCGSDRVGSENQGLYRQSQLNGLSDVQTVGIAEKGGRALLAFPSPGGVGREWVVPVVAGRSCHSQDCFCYTLCAQLTDLQRWGSKEWELRVGVPLPC